MSKLEELEREKENLESRLNAVNTEIENTPDPKPLSDLGKEALQSLKRYNDQWDRSKRNYQK